MQSIHEIASDIVAREGGFVNAPDDPGDAYGIERRNYYYALGDPRKRSRKYTCRQDGGKGGWIVRAEEFIAAKYHLTDAEHRARVAVGCHRQFFILAPAIR